MSIDLLRLEAQALHLVEVFRGTVSPNFRAVWIEFGGRRGGDGLEITVVLEREAARDRAWIAAAATAFAARRGSDERVPWYVVIVPGPVPAPPLRTAIVVYRRGVTDRDRPG